MKGKIIRGKGFRGCLEYLLAKLKQAKIIAGNLLGRTPWTLSREFAVVRQILPDCEKPVLHIPLRLPPGDDIANPVWTKVALRYFELMNLSPDRPWILVRHDEHVHLLTSRISYAGELWYGKWEGLNHINATQVLEMEFNLTRTPGLEGADAKQARLTSGQIAKYQRELENGGTPKMPGKTYIAESIESALAKCDGSMDGFNQHLKIYGVTTKVNQGKTSLVTGISFKFGEVEIKGSKVARAYSWLKLLKLLKERKQQYENEQLAKSNEKTSDRTNQEPGISASSTTLDGQLEHDSSPNHTPATTPEDHVVYDSPDLPVAVGDGGLAATPDILDSKPVEREGAGHPTDLRMVETERHPGLTLGNTEEITNTEEVIEERDNPLPPLSPGR